MRVMIENYRNLTAGHCGSGAMRNLIYHYCGLDLPEGVVFGLGAGVDTVYFDYPGQRPPFMLFGRGASMEADLAESLGMDYSEQLEPDDDQAWAAVRQEVIEGRPTMLAGDIYYLDYRQHKIHFPSHRFVLLGFDDDTQEVFIADRVREETETCTMAALRKSRNSPAGMSDLNRWGKFTSGAQRHALALACGIALRKSAERMLGMDQSQRRAMAQAAGHNDGTLEVGLKGLRTLCQEFSGWSQREDVKDRIVYLDNAIIKYGTGGGFFRNHFAVFMAWSRDQRPDLVSDVTVALAAETAQRWNALSEVLQAILQDPDQGAHWATAGEQLEDIYETEYSLFGHLADTVLRAA